MLWEFWLTELERSESSDAVGLAGFVEFYAKLENAMRVLAH